MSYQSSIVKSVPLAVALAVAGFGVSAYAQGGASATADVRSGTNAGVGGSKVGIDPAVSGDTTVNPNTPKTPKMSQSGATPKKSGVQDGATVQNDASMAGPKAAMNKPTSGKTRSEVKAEAKTDTSMPVTSSAQKAGVRGGEGSATDKVITR